MLENKSKSSQRGFSFSLKKKKGNDSIHRGISKTNPPMHTVKRLERILAVWKIEISNKKRKDDELRTILTSRQK